ncbi:TniQ family protein [Streptomyces nigrescens]|uniref:TniQ family protein n=1 Tax=Streptomyces nigrescens TaxID=1920 RepID=UPI0036CD69D4
MTLPADRQLARSLVPLPGESLGGFVLRLSYRLGLSPHRVASLCGLDRRSDSVSEEHLRELSRDAAQRLADSARLTLLEVHSLTLAELARTYPPLSELRTDASAGNAKGRSIHSNWSLNSDRRYCPECLRGDGSPVQEAFGGAWRLRWHLPVVFACTQHRRLLEHTCPACAQPQSVRVVSRYSLVQLPHVARLHPAQCRNQAPGVARRFHGRATACGARLDAGSQAGTTLAATDRDRVLVLQEQLNARLSPAPPVDHSEASRGGTYFSDLLLVARLITLSWPLGAPLVPSSALADLVDQHASSAAGDIRERFKAQRRSPRGAAHCAALLLAAATALGDREVVALRERVEPLAREVYRQSTSMGTKLFNGSGASAALLRATVPRIYGVQKRDALRTTPRPHRYRVEEIPPLLPRGWYAEHLEPLTHRLARVTSVVERHLRWAASLRLAELISGQSWRMCAAGLDIPASSAVKTMNVLGQPMAVAGLWPAFERAVDDIARLLDEQELRIDYAHRRRTMANWRLARGTWRDLCAGIPGLEQQGATGDLNVGEALIWSRVNEASYLHSPAVTVHRSASTAPGRITCTAGQILRRPRTSYTALSQRLERYAGLIARACDEGRDLDVPIPGEARLGSPLTSRWAGT